MAGPNEGLRLLAEISGKLDWALKTSTPGAPKTPAPGSGGGLDLNVARALCSLGACADSQAVVEAVLDAAVGATKADRAFVMLLEEGRKLRFKGGRAIDQDTVAAEGAVTSKTVIKKVITTVDTVLIENTSEMPEIMSASIAGMIKRSLICVPFRMYANSPDGKPRCGGVLYIDTRADVKKLAGADVELALAIADAGAIAIERIETGVVVARPAPGGGGGGGGGASSAALNAARAQATAATAEAQKIKENMTRLLDVGRAIGTTLVLDDLLVLTLEKVLEVTKADRGFIMLLEGGKPVFKIGRAWNKKEGAEKKTYKLNETQFFFSRTIINRALDEGRSVCIKDTVGGGEDASVSIVQMELQSVMATPLKEKNNTLGLIYVDSKATNRDFDQGDLELFEALSGQAAIAMQNAILYATAKEKSRLEGEIQIAARMQQDMCPQVMPTFEGLEIFGLMVPAKEVGGDYFDLVEDIHNPGTSLSLVVGDVSGKGLPAGIVAVMARCFLRSMITAYGVESPRNLLSYLNTILSADLKPGVFMTMLMCVWDAQRKTLKYSAAGHEHLIVYRGRTKTAESIPSGGVALGLSAKTEPIPDAEVRLNPGDTLVLYSDGVTEAMNEESEEYTMEKLLESVKRHGTKPAKELCDALNADVQKHVGKADQSDDITLLVMRRTS